MEIDRRALIIAGTVTTVAVLAGQGTAWLLARTLFPTEVEAPTPALALATARAPRDPCALLDGETFFDSALDATCAAQPPTPLPPAGDVDDHTSVAACEGALRLVGTVVPRAHGRAFAAIEDASGRSVLYAESMPVGERIVAAITREAVQLAAEDGSRCALTLFDHDAPGAPATATASPDDAIRARGPGAYRVSRRLVEQLMASRDTLSALRVLPHEDAQGAPDGVRVFGVRAGSVAARLGLANGDVLSAVNGHSLADPGSALDAYAELRTAAAVSVRGARNGAPLAIDYEID